MAKRSLGPILFIALQVEGERGRQVALVIGVALLIAAGAVVIRRRGRDTLYPVTSMLPWRRTQRSLFG